jgi:hypothetical protein
MRSTALPAKLAPVQVGPLEGGDGIKVPQLLDAPTSPRERSRRGEAEEKRLASR